MASASEARVGPHRIAEAGVRFAEVGENLGHEAGRVLAREFESRLAEADGEEVLATLRAQLRHVGERDRIEVGAIELAVGAQCRLVGDDGTIGVAEGVMDGGDRVEQVALVDAVIGGAVLLQAAQAAGECLAVVAGVEVHDPHQVEGPHLDHDGTALAGEIARIDGNPERLVGLAAVVRQAGEPVERFCFTSFIAVRTSQDASLLHEHSCIRSVLVLDRLRLIEQRTHRR